MPSKTLSSAYYLSPEKNVALKIRTIFSIKRKLEASLTIKSFLLHLSTDSSVAGDALVATVTGITKLN
jgi:hypothetical protein